MIGLNTFIVSRLEFFGITFDAHPHSGWFICHAPTERDGLKVTNKRDKITFYGTMILSPFLYFMRPAGLEPAQVYTHCPLKTARLPFRHDRSMYVMVSKFSSECKCYQSLTLLPFRIRI